MKHFSLLVLLMACSMLAPPSAYAQRAALCEYLSGGTLPPKGLPLAPALEKLAAGDVGAAYKAATAAVAEFSKLAGALFLEADSPNTMVQARSLVDGQLLTAEGILAVRGDYFTLRHDVLAWLAWLGCKAGEYDSALYWLRLGTRDYANSVFNQEAALVLLAAGRRDAAATHLVAQAQKAFQLVASGWYLCTGKDTAGSTLLEQAAGLISDQGSKGRLLTWAKECAAGKLVP